MLVNSKAYIFQIEEQCDHLYMNPTPSPTKWLHGPQHEVEKCVGSSHQWSPHSDAGALPPLVIGSLVQFVFFSLFLYLFELYIKRIKFGSSNIPMFLPPPIIITLFRYIFFQTIFQNFYLVILFYSFLLGQNFEVACYLQYYRPNDELYGNMGGIITFGLLVYLHILVNWIIRPSAGYRMSSAIGKYIIENQSSSLYNKDDTVKIMSVGSLDGFHATKLALYMKENFKKSLFLLTGMDLYGGGEEKEEGREGVIEECLLNNARALHVDQVIKTTCVYHNQDGNVEISNKQTLIEEDQQDYIVILGDYISRHPILGLEYESNELVQNHRLFALLMELKSKVLKLKKYNTQDHGKILIVNSNKNNLNRWKTVMKSAGLDDVKVVEVEVEGDGLFAKIRKYLTGKFPIVYILEGSHHISQEKLTKENNQEFIRQSLETEQVQFNKLLEERMSQQDDINEISDSNDHVKLDLRVIEGSNKAYSYYIWKLCILLCIIIYTIIFIVTIITFPYLKVPKKVGILLYFNYFLLSILNQLPPALIVGLYLLHIKYKRSFILSKKEIIKFACEFMIGSFIVGLAQSFFFGYLFTMIINYFVLFQLFGLATTSNYTLYIDIGIGFVFVSLLMKFSKGKDEEDEDDEARSNTTDTGIDMDKIYGRK